MIPVSNAYEVVIRRAQRCLETLPVIVLGSGASAGYGIPGMAALKDHLLGSIQVVESDPAYGVWEELKEHLETHDLETSLQKVHVSESLLKQIIHQTWLLINDADLDVFESVVNGKLSLALTDLYRHLFTSVHNTLHVVTPNYDRLAEYAADAGDFSSSTGFGYGYLRFRGNHRLVRRDGREARMVRVWKVHGSLDWFTRQDETLLALPPSREIVDGLKPAIVTPGVSKYEAAYQEPFRSAINGADTALQSAAGYLCIGYGFNDKHIQPKLEERVRRDATPIVVLAKTLSSSAKQLLLEGRCREYLALEEGGEGCTRAYLPEYPEGVMLEGACIWGLRKFLNRTISNERRTEHVSVSFQ